MTKTFSLTAGISVAFFVALLALLPVRTHAVSPHAFLGGGNALARATSGESQGLAHASSTSDLLSHLTFASTRGGREAEVPPTASTTATTSTPQSDENGADSNESLNGQAGSGSNGGARGGNGGNGGGGSTGGVVRAGSVVSNANAVNVLNTIIVRIGR